MKRVMLSMLIGVVLGECASAPTEMERLTADYGAAPENYEEII